MIDAEVSGQAVVGHSDGENSSSTPHGRQRESGRDGGLPDATFARDNEQILMH